MQKRKLILFFYLLIILKFCKSSNDFNLRVSKMFNKNIIDLVLENDFFRKEIVTGPNSQVVLMNIAVGEEIGEEIHKVDQILIFVKGNGQAIIDDKVSEIHANHLIFVPAGTKHNFKNTGNQDLKLLTIYAPAEHKPGTIQKTKSEYED